MICNPCEVSMIKPMVIKCEYPTEEIRSTPDEMIEKICGFYGVPVSKVFKKTRKREVVFARQVCMYVFTRKTNLTLCSIGEIFGMLDHTTVGYARDTIKDFMDVDMQIKADVEYLVNAVGRYQHVKPKTNSETISREIRKSKNIIKLFKDAILQQDDIGVDFIRPAAVYSNHSAYGIANSL